MRAQPESEARAAGAGLPDGFAGGDSEAQRGESAEIRRVHADVRTLGSNCDQTLR